MARAPMACLTSSSLSPAAGPRSARSRESVRRMSAASATRRGMRAGSGTVVGAREFWLLSSNSHAATVHCSGPVSPPTAWASARESGPAPVEACVPGGVLWILHSKSYDAGTVSRSTATSLRYAAAAFAPWIVREPGPPAPPRPRLLDRVREAIRARHYSRRTEKAYVHWIRRFIFFHDTRHPADMGPAEVTAFLTSLAVRDKVAASTQNQALSALLFLYREVLDVDLPWLDDVVRAKRPQYLPVVLTRDETRAVLQRLNGVPRIMPLLLYGAV